MKSKSISATLSLLLLLSILGCLGSSVPRILEPPPFKESKKVVVISFVTNTTDKELGDLGRQISYNLATRLSLMIKETEWVYDQSENLAPVSTEMKNLKLSLAELVESTELAAKLGKAMNAKLVVLGEVKKPNLKKQDNDKPLKPSDKRYAGIAGTTRYVTTRQVATADVIVKVIDVDTEKPIFSDQIKGYIKYWYAYQTQQRGQIVLKDKEQIYADLNGHLTRRIMHVLYPSGTSDIVIPEILLKPDIKLIGSQGEVIFN